MGELRGNALTNGSLRRRPGQAKLGQQVRGELIAACTALDEQVGFATVRQLAAARTDGPEHREVPVRQLVVRRGEHGDSPTGLGSIAAAWTAPRRRWFH